MLNSKDMKEGHPNGGVPQGTLSGPKDILIHINQLKTECPLFKYVDDCTIFECLTKPMVSRIQLSLDELCAWSTENHMRVNRTKTKEIIMDFSASNSVAEIPLLTIHDEPIERVTHATVVGVTVSSDLTWNQLKRSGVSQEDLLKLYLS